MQAIVNADSSGFWGFVFIPSLFFFFFLFAWNSPFCLPVLKPQKRKQCLKDKTLPRLYIIFHEKKNSIKNSTLSVFKNIANQCVEMLKFPDQQVHFKGYCLINTELIKSGNNTDNNQLETFYLYI